MGVKAMNRNLVFVVMGLIFCVTVFFSVWYYVENARYEIVATESLAYKIDKKTGGLWVVTPRGYRKLETRQKQP